MTGRARHRFYVSPEQTQGSTVQLTREQAHQIRSVLRLRPGALVRVFDGLERDDRVVRLETLERHTALGEVVGHVSHAREPAVEVWAYPSIGARETLERVLQKLTEVGVAGMTPVVSAHSESWKGDDDGARRRRWDAIVREAAEQSERGVVPPVAGVRELKEAFAEAVPRGPTLLAYERTGGLPLRDALRAPGEEPTRVSLFVGPEGGYSVEEVALARELGVRLVSLGERILRMETAAPVLAALVLYELDRPPPVEAVSSV